MLDYSATNPLREPAWCWLRAEAARAGTQPGPSRRIDGLIGYKWIRQAMQFQHEYAQARDEWAHYTLASRRPALYWAYRVWERASPFRSGIEARILAGDDNFTVGFAGGLTPETVEAYEAVFYNVRDRLPHQDVIIRVLLARAAEQGVQGRDYDLLWKLYAYFCGSEAFQAVANGFVSPSRVSSADTVNAALEADAIATLKLKAALAAHTVGVNPQTQLELLAAFTKFVEVERTSEAAGHQENQIIAHVEAMFSALHFDVAGRDPHTGQLAPSKISQATARFTAKGVELSFEDQLRAAAGLPVPAAEEAMTFEWPPPNPGSSS